MVNLVDYLGEVLILMLLGFIGAITHLYYFIYHIIIPKIGDIKEKNTNLEMKVSHIDILTENITEIKESLHRSELCILESKVKTENNLKCLTEKVTELYNSIEKRKPEGNS
jgi:hypothetical protein